jgi:hypothetical protein
MHSIFNLNDADSVKGTIMKKRLIVGISFALLSLMIVTVSAFVYEQYQQTVEQTVVNVVNLTIKNSALGSIDEGDSKSYTKADLAALGAAISLTTTKPNVYLHLNSDIDSLSTYYSTYIITVKYLTVPGGSSHAAGQTAATMTLASPDPTAITLDIAGSWVFDFELTTTAKSVSSDQASTATIIVTAEST